MRNENERDRHTDREREGGGEIVMEGEGGRESKRER